jgi:hypothetical protein
VNIWLKLNQAFLVSNHEVLVVLPPGLGGMHESLLNCTTAGIVLLQLAAAWVKIWAIYN